MTDAAVPIKMDPFLASDDVEYRDVETRGQTFRIREMTAGEATAFLESLDGGDRVDQDRMAMIVQMTCIREDGQRRFSEADRPLLTSKPNLVISLLANTALELSGLAEKKD